MIVPDVPLPPQQQEIILMHDARAVHDTAALSVFKFVENNKSNWILVTIVPGPDSGSTTIPGAFIQAETGQLENPEGSDTYTEKQGQWTAIDMSDAAIYPTKGAYSWLEPLGTRKRILEPEDYYSVFVYGGIILFLPRLSEKGKSQFESVYLLFRDWSAFVAEMFALAGPQNDFLRAEKSSDPLKTLLNHKNLIIATIAFRELMTVRQIPPNMAGRQLSAADGRYASILCYLMATIGNHNGVMPQMTQEIIGEVAASNDLEKLHAIALGAFAAGVFRSEETVTSSAKAITNAVYEKINNKGWSPDAQLRLIFDKMGIHWLKE